MYESLLDPRFEYDRAVACEVLGTYSRGVHLRCNGGQYERTINPKVLEKQFRRMEP